MNVSTISARTGGGAGSGIYAASKAFVSGVTRSLVSELSPYNVELMLFLVLLLPSFMSNIQLQKN